MTEFRVESSFWDLFPDAHFGVVLAKNIDNSGESSGAIKRLLYEEYEHSDNFTGASVFSENPAVAIWREAYKKFPTKKRAYASIENLLKRVSKGNEIRTINPLVDLYNSISLTYGLPAGGEDLDTFSGDLRLLTAVGGETFIGIGEEKSDPCLEGEVAYVDEIGAVCRCWNWRDGQRTMLTEHTKNAFLIVESCVAEQEETLQRATEKLAELVKAHFGCEAEAVIVSKENPKLKL